MFRGRRPPARRRRPPQAVAKTATKPNGGWRVDLQAIGQQVVDAFGAAKPKRRGDNAGRRAAQAQQYVAQHGGYLAAHAVEKSFVGRKVVKGASLYVRRGEAVGLLGP